MHLGLNKCIRKEEKKGPGLPGLADRPLVSSFLLTLRFSGEEDVPTERGGLGWAPYTVMYGFVWIADIPSQNCQCLETAEVLLWRWEESRRGQKMPVIFVLYLGIESSCPLSGR